MNLVQNPKDWKPGALGFAVEVRLQELQVVISGLHHKRSSSNPGAVIRHWKGSPERNLDSYRIAGGQSPRGKHGAGFQDLLERHIELLKAPIYANKHVSYLLSVVNSLTLALREPHAEVSATVLRGTPSQSSAKPALGVTQ